MSRLLSRSAGPQPAEPSRLGPRRGASVHASRRAVGALDTGTARGARRDPGPLKIALVTATFPPYRGGTGNVCFHNARELARRGHEAHVFTAALPGAPAHETIEGVVVHRLRPLARAGNAPLLPALSWRLRGFDVIHLHYPFFGGEITALAAKLSRAPLVITYHQDVLLSGVAGLLERLLRRTVGRLALRSATRPAKLTRPVMPRRPASAS